MDDDVLPLVVESHGRPEYFVRTINDHGAHNDGVSMELQAVLGSHPPEDVMHLGGWIQLYTILHSGTKPLRFEYFPNYNGRVPELVAGRNYPLQGADPSLVGTVCLLPEGVQDMYRITFMKRNPVDPDARRRHEDAIIHMHRGVEHWYAKVAGHNMAVAPLVFRRHAVFRNDDCADAAPYVAVNFMVNGRVNSGGDRQFVCVTGDYTLAQGEGRLKRVCFIDAHASLVPIGAFMMVNKSALAQFGLFCEKDWVRGSLRYPEDEVVSGDDHQYNIYVMIKLKGRGEGSVRVVCVPVSSCRVADTSGIRQGDFCVSAFLQLLNAGGGADGGGGVDAPQ